MRVSNYYDIEEINLKNSKNKFYITSTKSSIYVQQLKLGFLYLFGIYNGKVKNKSFDIEMNNCQISPNNTQLRFVPADIYYKRDVEYGSNSVILNLILNVLENNPKYNEYVQEIYDLIGEKFGAKICVSSSIEINIEAAEVNLKKLLGLLEVSLDINGEELEEIDMTEYELKILYLEILSLMSVEGENILYLIESPEAGLNYAEKLNFMDYVNKLDNVIVFTNDIDILKTSQNFGEINIIDDPNYKFDFESFSKEMRVIYPKETLEQVKLSISKVLLDNLETLCKGKDVCSVEDIKNRNIILNYLEKIAMK